MGARTAAAAAVLVLSAVALTGCNGQQCPSAAGYVETKGGGGGGGHASSGHASSGGSHVSEPAPAVGRPGPIFPFWGHPNGGSAACPGK